MTRRRRDRGPDVRIEYPCAGATYHLAEYGVYEYGVYERSSVLAGQTKRVFLDSFPTLAEAQAAYPGAVSVAGCGYAPPSLHHLPDSGDE
jgi:hypothetical protein